MKNILLIGVGGTGSKAVDIFFQKKKELGDQAGNNVTALVFDTDAGDLKKISAASTVVMADNASVGTICDRFGLEFLKEWFPCDDKAVRSQEMLRGASQWRKKSYLAFLNLMNKPLARQTFISALEKMTADPGYSCEIYVIASVAGGTGSGSFIPIALYAKRYLRKTLGKDPIVNAMIALPDIYADSQTPENRIKVYSNAYAILRELNAINLVARNYNSGLAEHKKAPIRFRIGDPKEPSVGLLFDASDKQFWTPEAAPFSQVFLLDRIPGLNSVAAHDIVLANSLYTILCTEIGAKFDSEFSNHELLRSQNNGSNAIYAGISTSQIRFPKDSVLDYLAHKKTMDSCDNEWLTLHKAVESAIKEKEQQMKALKRKFTMKEGEYASIVIEELEKLEDNNNDEILTILERCVYQYDSDGTKSDDNAATLFANKLDAYISSKIPNFSEIEEEIKKLNPSNNARGNKLERKATISFVKDSGELLFDYYKICVDNIKRLSGSTADSVITLDKKKENIVGKDYSVIEKLLKKNDKFVHPVAAMIQLCYLRNSITEWLNNNRVEEWDSLRKRNIEAIPSELLVAPNRSTENNSAYYTLGDDRFERLYDGDDGESAYKKAKRTNVKADLDNVLADTRAILDKISSDAQVQMHSKVYKVIVKNIDILISKYRNFFNRFEKEKEDLEEQTKTAYRKDAGNVDSIINVFSSQKHKDYIYKNIIDDAGPITDEEISNTDDIVGFGVFTTVYNSAASEFAEDKSWNEKDSKAYRSLFGNMVKAYKTSIEKSEAYEKIASYNAIEAIYESCGNNPDDKAINEAFKLRFSLAQELATPSIRLDPNENTHDLVRPSNIMVFMMSEETGKYIKKNAEKFGIDLPADQNKESEVVEACAEQFIRKFSGNNSARVSVVSSMPDNVLYCTGEIMDITPLRIAKFNELGDDNVYFKNYSIAIENYKKYGTDMWNPHLGNDLHKRGYLPYMNQEKEKDCDVKVVKALLYAFQKGHVTFQTSVGARDAFFFKCNGKKITDSEGRWINRKNIAQLISWLRNEDELVEEWSELFEREIQRQKNLLPSLASDNPNEIRNLESSLTSTPFMNMLTEKLYVDASANVMRIKNSSNGPVTVKRDGPTAIEFAYMVKTSEELGRDCDDAERLLEVLYGIFKDMCAYRTNPQLNPERFIQVYGQQLGNFYEAMATARQVYEAGAECESHFNQFTTWLNQANVFNAISADTPMDDKGNVCIDSVYDYTKDKDGGARKILLAIKKGVKNAIAEVISEVENTEALVTDTEVVIPVKTAKGKKVKAAVDTASEEVEAETKEASAEAEEVAEDKKYE